MSRNEYRGDYKGPGASCANCRDKRPLRRAPIGLKLRFQILQRDNFTCRYCGRKAPDVVLHVDHVTPVSQGGLSEPDNLVAACEDCNLGKKDVLLIATPDAWTTGR
jgi:5-methylcytosine-specific restriction endonuclease McrA